MDEHLDRFLNQAGMAPAMYTQPVDDEVLAYYKDKLPDRLLGYWKEYGFCGYGEGLFWTVNPADYNELLETWLKQTPIWGRENFYVIARTAFGELYVWGDKCFDTTVIDPHYNTVFPEDLPEEELTLEQRERFLGIFIANITKKSGDFHDKDENLLFQRSLKKLGHLEHDEMYTFVPALAAGGTADIEHVKKVKIHEQLGFLCGLDTPMMLSSINETLGDSLFDV